MVKLSKIGGILSLKPIVQVTGKNFSDINVAKGEESFKNDSVQLELNYMWNGKKNCNVLECKSSLVPICLE